MVTIKESVDIRIIQGLDGGKTLAITLPKIWMKQFGLTKGDRIKLTKIGRRIELRKLEL